MSESEAAPQVQAEGYALACFRPKLSDAEVSQHERVTRLGGSVLSVKHLGTFSHTKLETVHAYLLSLDTEVTVSQVYYSDKGICILPLSKFMFDAVQSLSSMKTVLKNLVTSKLSSEAELMASFLMDPVVIQEHIDYAEKVNSLTDHLKDPHVIDMVASIPVIGLSFAEKLKSTDPADAKELAALLGCLVSVCTVTTDIYQIFNSILNAEESLKKVVRPRINECMDRFSSLRESLVGIRSALDDVLRLMDSEKRKRDALIQCLQDVKELVQDAKELRADMLELRNFMLSLSNQVTATMERAKKRRNAHAGFIVVQIVASGISLYTGGINDTIALANLTNSAIRATGAASMHFAVHKLEKLSCELKEYTDISEKATTALSQLINRLTTSSRRNINAFNDTYIRRLQDHVQRCIESCSGVLESWDDCEFRTLA